MQERSNFQHPLSLKVSAILLFAKLLTLVATAYKDSAKSKAKEPFSALLAGICIVLMRLVVQLLPAC